MGTGDTKREDWRGVFKVISFEEAIKKKKFLENTVNVCEEINDFIKELLSEDCEVFPESFSNEDKGLCVNDLQKLIEKYRVGLLTELQTLSKSEVNFGNDTSKNSTPTKKRRPRNSKKDS